MNPKDILDNLDNIDIENITLAKADICEFDQQKSLRGVKNKIKDRKRKQYIKVACMFLALLTLGAISTKSFASELPFIKDIYKQFGAFDGFEDYTTFIGQTQEKNGFKVTIDNIVASKNTLIVTTTINSTEEFEMSPKEDEYVLSILNAQKYGITGYSISPSISYIDNHNLALTTIIETTDSLPVKGELNLSLNLDFKEYMNFKLNIDFSTCIGETKTYDINRELNNIFDIKSLEINPLGASLFLEDKPGNSNEHVPIFYLIVDGVYYGDNLSGGDGKTIRVRFENITSNKITKNSKISLIAVSPIQDGKCDEVVTYKSFESGTYPSKIVTPLGQNAEIKDIFFKDNTLNLTFTSEYNPLLELRSLVLFKDNSPLPHCGEIKKINDNTYTVSYKNIYKDDVWKVIHFFGRTNFDKDPSIYSLKIK